MNKQKFQFESKAKLANISEDRIQNIAKKLGMVLPSTHTALFQSPLLAIDEANANGVRISKEAVEESIPKWIMSQANINHKGNGFVVGSILDAWLNDNNEIEIVYSFAKNVYQDEYLEALEAMADGELTVSFELLADQIDIQKLDDKTVRLNAIDPQGVGVLIRVPPAYKKAKTFKMASILRERAIESEKELICAKEIIQSLNKIIGDYPTDTTMVNDDPFTETPEQAVIYIVTTTEDGHFHIAETDLWGNGETIGVYGKDEAYHVHKIMDFQIQETENHVHKIMNEFMAQLKEHIENKKKKKHLRWNYYKMEEELLESERWTTSYINDLPDSSFAVIEPAYKTGKNSNKNARHLPYKDKTGKIDLPHYRNALARVNQILPITDSISADELRKQATDNLAKHKEILKSEEQTTQGGSKIMTDEQKNIVAQLRTELEGYLTADTKDEDLLDQAKVEAFKKAKSDAEAKKAEDEAKAKADAEAVSVEADLNKVKDEALEEAKKVIEAQKTKISELEATVESQKKEIEVTKAEVEFVKANYDKVSALKVELKGNEYTKDFTDADYLDESKVEKAKILKERDDLKAENEALKAGKVEVKATDVKKVDMPIGENNTSIDNPIRTARKQK